MNKTNSYKVILLGDGSVGKTSIRHQFIGSGFKSRYSMTIGADFSVKRYKNLTIQIWDLAGQTRFKAVREVYYRGSVGAIIVFDTNRRKTFENIPNWIKELLNNNKDKMIPIIIVGNKIDLRNSKSVKKEEGMKYAQILSKWSGKNITYVETSAKQNINIKQIFDKLLQEMIKQRY